MGNIVVTTDVLNDRYIAECDFDRRAIVRQAGFVLDKSKNFWFTTSVNVAARLRDYADSTTLKIINKVMLEVKPWAGRLLIDERFRPYQNDMQKFSLERNRSYLGAAAGLGKTPVAASILRTLKNFFKDTFVGVYICPSFLVQDVQEKFRNWEPSLVTEKFDRAATFGDVMIVSDSLFTHRDVYTAIRNFIKGNNRRVLIIDEAHRFKNDEADRTRMLFGHTTKAGVHTPAIVDMFNTIVSMSGDPMPNRPLELYPNLSKLAPETIDFMSRDDFGMKYCAGRWNGHGMEYKGASNLRELAARVQGKYMLRLRKDVLPLPPLTEEILLMSEDMPSELQEFEYDILKKYPLEDLMRIVITKEQNRNYLHLMSYQRLLGLKKVKFSVDYLEHLLEAEHSNHLIFTRHREVLAEFKKECERRKIPAMILDMDGEKRREAVQTFTNSPKLRAIAGNIKAIGIGLDIIKADELLNIEPSWSRMENEQAAARSHRMGQTKPVTSRFVCYRNSIDHKVLMSEFKKRKLGAYI